MFQKKLFPGRDLSELETLEFSNTETSKIEIKFFADMEALTTLKITNNLLTSIDPLVFTLQLGTTLESLDLSKNKLKPLSMRALNNLPNLKTLNLSGNVGINFCDFLFPPGLKALTTLDLSNCGIENMGKEVFYYLRLVLHILQMWILFFHFLIIKHN